MTISFSEAELKAAIGEYLSRRTSPEFVCQVETFGFDEQDGFYSDVSIAPRPENVIAIDEVANGA